MIVAHDVKVAATMKRTITLGDGRIMSDQSKRNPVQLKLVVTALSRTADIIRSALRSLSTNKLRSALTTLGIFIGVASVVVMVAVGIRYAATIEEEVERLGANVIMVIAGHCRRLQPAKRSAADAVKRHAVAIRDDGAGIDYGSTQHRWLRPFGHCARRLGLPAYTALPKTTLSPATATSNPAG